MGIIVGYEKEKSELAHLHNMLKNVEQYREYGVRIPHGLVLYGEPGVGKTVLARSIATDGISLVELRAANCCEEDAIDEIKKTFEIARTKAPTMLLLDELDKIAGTSAHFFMESNDAVKKTLLQELDSLNDRDDVLVVATCNDIDVLGEALLRAGRFDRKIHIDLPDTNTRKLILEEYLGKMKFDYDFDIQYVAQYTQSYTGAKLESLINEAGIIAMQKENRVINIDDIKTIMRKFVFDGDERNAFDDMEDLRKVAVHEAGHAIVAMLLTPDNIHGASVLPQGDSNGHISFVRTESNVISIEDIEHEITVFLAGRVAERMIFNKNFTGSASDIAKATSSLYFLIVECAAYGYDGAVFTVRTPYRKEFYSEQAKTDVNNLVKNKLEEFERFAELLIGKAYPAFEAIVGYLMEKHTLTRDELFEILMNYGLDQSVA